MELTEASAAVAPAPARNAGKRRIERTFWLGLIVCEAAWIGALVYLILWLV